MTRGFCWHQNFVPLTCGYIHLLNHEKMCIKSEVEEFLFKLAINDHRDEAFLLTQNFGPNGLSAPAQGLCTCIKSWKNMHKVRGQSCFLKHAKVIKVIRPFACIKKIVPKGCLFLPWGFIDMHEIKQNIIKIMQQKGSFWNLYKMMGIIKACICCQNLYQVVVCPCLGLLSNDDPGLMTIFKTGSNLL